MATHGNGPFQHEPDVFREAGKRPGQLFCPGLLFWRGSRWGGVFSFQFSVVSGQWPVIHRISVFSASQWLIQSGTVGLAAALGQSSKGVAPA